MLNTNVFDAQDELDDDDEENEQCFYNENDSKVPINQIANETHSKKEIDVKIII